MAISPQRLTIYLYSAHRVVIFAIAQLSCLTLFLKRLEVLNRLFIWCCTLHKLSSCVCVVGQLSDFLVFQSGVLNWRVLAPDCFVTAKDQVLNILLLMQSQVSPLVLIIWLTFIVLMMWFSLLECFKFASQSTQARSANKLDKDYCPVILRFR